MFDNDQTRNKKFWPKNGRNRIRRNRLYEPENVNLNNGNFQPGIPFERQYYRYSMDQDSYFQNQMFFRHDIPIPLPSSFDVLSSERSYLLSKLQRADAAATDFLKRISHLEDSNKHETDRTITKKNRQLIGWFKSKLHETTKQEHSILLRLGQVTYEIQYAERWNRIENERLQQQQLNHNSYSFPNMNLDAQYLPLSPLAGPVFMPSDTFTPSGFAPNEYFGNFAHPPTLDTMQAGTREHSDVYQSVRVWPPNNNHDDHPHNPTMALPNILAEPVELAAPSFHSDGGTHTNIDANLNHQAPSEKRPLSLNTLLDIGFGNGEKEKRLSLPALKTLWDEIPGGEMGQELEQELEEEKEASGRYVGYYIEKEG